MYNAYLYIYIYIVFKAYDSPLFMFYYSHCAKEKKFFHCVWQKILIKMCLIKMRIYWFM